jgi:hypothetical protein
MDYRQQFQWILRHRVVRLEMAIGRLLLLLMERYTSMKTPLLFDIVFFFYLPVAFRNRVEVLALLALWTVGRFIHLHSGLYHWELSLLEIVLACIIALEKTDDTFPEKK